MNIALDILRGFLVLVLSTSGMIGGLVLGIWLSELPNTHDSGRTTVAMIGGGGLFIAVVGILAAFMARKYPG